MTTALNQRRCSAVPVLDLAKGLLALCFGIVTVGLSTGPSFAAMPVVYQTAFERSQGYDTNLDLVGQNGWVGAGSGGNGLVTGFFPGRGQQAYIGFAPPNPGYDSLFVYRPINRNLSQAQFSVTMAVADSSNAQYDDFYWSVFNQQGDQLFTLDFDNSALRVNYALETSTNWISSGLTFTNGVSYPLTMSLNLVANHWSATFRGVLLATNQPITTRGSPLNLGDIDAAWVVYDTNAPGDNFMVFDDYQVIGVVPSPQLRVLSFVGQAPTLRVSGQTNTAFALDASTNLVSWAALRTNVVAPNGYFDYVDNGAVGLRRRFYRARWVP
jgi:hypothetical protein